MIEHSLQRESQAVRSTRIFAKEEKTRKEIQGYTENLSELGKNFKTEAQRFYSGSCRTLGIKQKPMALTAEEKRLQRIVPLRSKDFVCPLQSEYVEEKLGQGVLGQIKLRGYAAYEAVNFADGKRSVYDIARAVSAEFGPVDAKDVEDFFNILEKAGLFRLKTL